MTPILLVHPESELRQRLARLLQRAGHSATAVATGSEATAIRSEEPQASCTPRKPAITPKHSPKAGYNFLCRAQPRRALFGSPNTPLTTTKSSRQSRHQHERPLSAQTRGEGCLRKAVSGSMPQPTGRDADRSVARLRDLCRRFSFRILDRGDPKPHLRRTGRSGEMAQRDRLPFVGTFARLTQPARIFPWRMMHDSSHGGNRTRTADPVFRTGNTARAENL